MGRASTMGREGWSGKRRPGGYSVALNLRVAPTTPPAAITVKEVNRVRHRLLYRQVALHHPDLVGRLPVREGHAPPVRMDRAHRGIVG